MMGALTNIYGPGEVGDTWDVKYVFLDLFTVDDYIKCHINRD